MTLRDLFRWAERYRLSSAGAHSFYDWEQCICEDGECFEVFMFCSQTLLCGTEIFGPILLHLWWCTKCLCFLLVLESFARWNVGQSFSSIIHSLVLLWDPFPRDQMSRPPAGLLRPTVCPDLYVSSSTRMGYFFNFNNFQFNTLLHLYN